MIAKFAGQNSFIEALSGLFAQDKGQGYGEEVFAKKMKKKNKTKKMGNIPN